MAGRAGAVVSLLALVAATVLWDAGREELPRRVSGEQVDIYGAVASVAGTLLGFTLASVAILIALGDGPRLRQFYDTGLHDRTLRLFGRAARWMGITAGAALAGLFVDPKPAQPLAAGDDLPLQSLWLLVVGALLLVAAWRFVRCLLILDKVVAAVVQDRKAATPPPPR